MHKLTRTIAMMGLLTPPAGAYALGVGDIRLRSALNQSFEADIPLALSGSDQVSDIKVTLAGTEAFAKAGIERHYYLTKLKFTPVQDSNGNYVIKVSSREAMREPFLSFLIEVNWPQGRMLREYTVLLDPPSSMPGESYAEISAPAAERAYARAERKVPAELPVEAGPPPELRTRSARRAASAAPREPVVPLAPPAPDQLTPDAYGPVRRDENLWNIAKSLSRDTEVSQEQMITALYRTNPQAFARNINTLKSGSILRLPTREFVTQLSPQQARAEYARLQGWRSGQITETRAPEQEIAAGAPQSQLRLLSPTDAKARGTGGEGAKIKGDLAIEIAETAKQENEEFRSKLSQFEQKLADLQRVLTLKDQQIATLESQLRSAPPQTKPAPLTVPPVVPAAKPVEPPVVTVKPQQPVAPAQVPPAVTVPEQPPVPAPEVAKAPEIVPPKPVPIPAPAPKPQPVKPPVHQAAPPEQPGFFSDPFYWAIGGGLGAIGLGAAYIIRRRNRIIQETESILLAHENDSQLKARVTASRDLQSTAGAFSMPSISAKSSFLSEFAPGDFDALGHDSGEVDPISEADVYLAYGRYQQAEELVRHAINEHPDRVECKLKLLEIFQATNNRREFEQYVRELKALGMESQPDFWSKVKDLGVEFLGDSAAFAGETSRESRPVAAYPAETSPRQQEALDLSDDLIDELKRFETEISDMSSQPNAADPARDLDFSFAAERTVPRPAVSPTAKSAQPEIASSASSVDFDLAGFSLDVPSAGAAEYSFDSTEPTGNSIDFDFGAKNSASVTATNLTEEMDEESSIDDLLSGLASSTSGATVGEADQPPEGKSVGKVAFDLDLYEPDFELEAVKPEPADISAGQAEAPAEDLFAGLTDMDQTETKLDLAKAYADMEDEDAACEILDEVLANGTEKQKAEARELLAKMGRGASDPGELSVTRSRSSKV